MELAEDVLGLKLVIPLGCMEGDAEAILLGAPEGELLGLELGETLGRTLGLPEGLLIGLELGLTIVLLKVSRLGTLKENYSDFC